MEELLRELISQNRQLLEILEEMSSKLDKLDDISSTLDTMDQTLHSVEMGLLDVKHSIDMGMLEVKSSSESIAHELEWHTDLTFASQVIKAIEQSGR